MTHQPFESDSTTGPTQWATLSRALRRRLRRYKERLEQQKTPVESSLGLLEWGTQHLSEHFTRQPSELHRWLAEMLDSMHTKRGTKINVLGPRGAAKSTIVTLAYVLRAALERREPYIWIISDTKHQACSHLENVKAELLENPVLAATYPHSVGKGRTWRNNAITLRAGPTVEAFGTGQRIRGRRRRAHRPTLIVCDDLQNDSHIESARGRELSRRWFHGMLMKAGTKRTNVINLATALHREALAIELSKTPGWGHRTFRAIQHWPTNMSLWEEWESIYCNLDEENCKPLARAFYEKNQAAMDAGAVLLWPEEEDLYTLMCMRVESGRTAFEREKQGSPLNPELCEWPDSYFHEPLWFDLWPSTLRVRVMALDPSKGHDAQRGDYSAFVMLGIDASGMLYVEANLARRPSPQIVADGVELYRRFRPDAFGVEANQFEELLAADFEEEFARQEVLGVRPWTLTNRVNKLVRIRRLGPFLSSQRLRFKADSPSTKLLVQQLRNFPAGDHDDGPDALEMAIRLAGALLENTSPSDGLGETLVHVT